MIVKYVESRRVINSVISLGVTDARTAGIDSFVIADEQIACHTREHSQCRECDRYFAPIEWRLFQHIRMLMQWSFFKHILITLIIIAGYVRLLNVYANFQFVVGHISVIRSVDDQHSVHKPLTGR